MKRIWITILVLLMVTQITMAAKGVVVFKKRGCDYFLVETTQGFALLEWYGGSDPDVGDTIVGDFESYGFTDVHNLTSDAELRVWVDDFRLSKSRAIESYYEKCD